MGLYVHSLSRLPLGLERNYYLYVLDYGWNEPLGQTLHDNFRRMADLAAKHKAVVIAGTDSRAFTDEVFSIYVDNSQFSYQRINGESSEEILPALMISTIHPQKFRDENFNSHRTKIEKGLATDKLIIIPLRNVCKNATEVVSLIERIFHDIAAQKPLIDFTIAKQINAGSHGAYSDAFILKPSLYGMGIDLKELAKTWKAKRV